MGASASFFVQNGQNFKNNMSKMRYFLYIKLQNCDFFNNLGKISSFSSFALLTFG